MKNRRARRRRPQAGRVTTALAPPPGWPAAGALAFKGVVARYKPELRAVLDGVSFELQPGNMMGVVRGGAAQAGPT